MKKLGKFLMVAVMAMASYSASAALEPQWSKGTFLLNVDLGIAPGGGSISGDYVLVDQWWKGHFTVGGELVLGFPFDTGVTIGLTPRASYGLNITPEFEVHAGSETGLGIKTFENGAGDFETSVFVLWANFIGCRYFFSDSFSVLGEVGYSGWYPSVRAGVSFKF